MKIFKPLLLINILFIFALHINKSYAQGLVEDISSPIVLGESSEMFTETIRIISRSQRIFILTNSNRQLYKGDFITIILNEKEPVARALVGKVHDGMVGIKIMKIYSLKRWALMRQNLDVQILKGDDSKLFVKVVEKPAEPEVQISGEEDLYNEKEVIDEDLDLFTKDNRLIKPDNVVGAAYSQFRVENTLTGDTEAHNQIVGSWAFQFADNMWVEGLFGVVTMNNFPGQQAQTVVSNYTVRAKYTFKAPFYSYILPYVGYQIYGVSSPNAGEVQDQNEAAAELEMIEKLEKRQIIGGVTILRRLVPGWFLRADLGNDILNVGFSIEF